jgi:hypothetical protein
VKGPDYAKRKEWRFILSRICEFLRMLDYLIQELLHRVVKTSVRHLYEYVSKSTGMRIDEKKNEDWQKFNDVSLDFSSKSFNTSYQSVESFQYSAQNIAAEPNQAFEVNDLQTSHGIDKVKLFSFIL